MEIALPRAVTLRGAEGGAKGLAVLTMSSPTPWARAESSFRLPARACRPAAT